MKYKRIKGSGEGCWDGVTLTGGRSSLLDVTEFALAAKADKAIKYHKMYHFWLDSSFRTIISSQLPPEFQVEQCAQTRLFDVSIRCSM